MATRKKKRKQQRRKQVDRSAYIHQPRNYADFFRRSRRYHAYTFNLPKYRLLKSDIDHVRRSSAVRDYIRSGDYSMAQIERYIIRRARDRAIDRQWTAAQKAAITRVWYGTNKRPGLGGTIRRVEQNVAQFVPYKNAHRSSMLRKLKTTSKGFFIWRENCDVWTRGKGLNLEIWIQPRPEPPEVRVRKPIRIEVFLPFPRGVIISDYVDKMMNAYEPPPDGVAIGVRGAKGNRPHDNVTGLDYLKEVIEQYEEQGQRHPFTGVFMYWF